MAVENDTDKLGHISTGAVIVRRQLKLGNATAGNLGAGEIDGNAVHVLGQFLTGEFTGVSGHIRKLEAESGIGCGCGVHHSGFIHSFFLQIF